jgi:hypothetical protein
MRLFNRLVSLIVAGTCIIGVFSGCATAPEKELAEAKAAIEAARQAEADKYMPKNFDNIQKALAAAEAEISKQNSAFILSRKYAKAKVMVNNAIKLAEQIKEDTPKAKADMIEQVTTGIERAKELAKETHGDIKRAPRSKAGKEAKAQMKADLTTAESMLAEAEGDFNAGDILNAKQKLGIAQKLLKKIFDQLSSSDEEDLM